MKNITKKTEKTVQVKKVRKFYPLAILAILTISTHPAKSFETYDIMADLDSSQIMPIMKKNPSSNVADSCSSLLKSIQYSSSGSATHKNQRSAEQATGIALIFGVRFALGPKEKHIRGKKLGKPRLDIWRPDGSYAGNTQVLAVSAYRQCQKEKALEALNGFRWKR